MTKKVKIGKVTIGGGEPIAVQSMTNTDTRDVEKTLEQIERLEEAGCRIVRMSVYNEECVEAISQIKKRTEIPLVADIHFDYRLAVASILAGIDKVRINPGNIGDKWKVREVAKAAADRGVPIRVGANMGSIDEKYFDRFKDRTDALVASAIDEIDELESVGFDNIVAAVKSSDAVETLVATEKISKLTDHPIHLGVTEAGVYEDSIVKSSFALGSLISEGIGDTIRVSIAGDPVKEVSAAYSILQAVHAFEGVEVIACPTCARTEIDVEEFATEIKDSLAGIRGKLKIAVMGCIVNGLGEARDADVAVFGTKAGGVIYNRGKKAGLFSREEVPSKLREIVEKEIKGGE